MPRNNSNSSSPSHSRSNHHIHKRKKPTRRSSSSQNYESHRKYKPEKDKYQKIEKGGRDDRQDKGGLRMVKNFKPQSDIRNHIKFENIRLNKPNGEQEIIANIGRQLSASVGPLAHVSRVPEGDGTTISVVLGFKHDVDALMFYKGNSGQLQYKYGKEMMKLTPVATQVFKLLMPSLQGELQAQLKRIKEKRGRERSWSDNGKSKHKKRDRKRSPSERSRRGSSDSDNSSDRGRRRKSHRHDERDRDRDRDYNNHKSHQGQKHSKQSKGMHPHKIDIKTFYLFGLPYYLKGNEVIKYFNNLTNNKIFVQSWKWKQIQQTNCQYMQITLNEQNAQRVLDMREDFKIDGSSFLVVQLPNNKSYESQEAIRQLLREYQVKISFKQQVPSSHVLKGVSECAKVVQMVSNNRLDQNGQSNSYHLTLISNAKAAQLKKLKLSSGITLSDPQAGLLVYRPTKTSKLQADVAL